VMFFCKPDIHSSREDRVIVEWGLRASPDLSSIVNELGGCVSYPCLSYFYLCEKYKYLLALVLGG
jgi:hypothetical protein